MRPKEIKKITVEIELKDWIALKKKLLDKNIGLAEWVRLKIKQELPTTEDRLESKLSTVKRK